MTDGIETGRGAAYLAYLAAPDPARLVRAVAENPCFDATCEDRSHYYAALVHATGMALDPFATHLRDGTGSTATLVDVLASLALRGRADALDLLVQHVLTGQRWDLALRALARADALDVLPGGPDLLARRLEEPAAARLRPPAWPAVSAPAPFPDLVDALQVAPSAARLSQLRRYNVADVLPLVRSWAGSPGPKGSFAQEYLLEHGTLEDVPFLVDLLTRFLDGPKSCWCEITDALFRLTELGATSVASQARTVWGTTPYSYARVAALTALLAFEPERADAYVIEGLYDSHELVRLLSVERAPQHLEVVLDAVASDPSEDPQVRALARSRVSTRTP